MIVTVIPVGPGREDNVNRVLACLSRQKVTAPVVLVEDGPALSSGFVTPENLVVKIVRTEKHEPGREQPRNIGVRVVAETWPHATHVWFLDSDIIIEPNCLEALVVGLASGPQDRILVAPYDWMGPDVLEPQHELHNDPRWEMFGFSPADKVYRNDLSAGLACFSGNLVWPISEFQRVGGFWNQLHMGRCEDGELGLRAVAMDVGISLVAEARGWHVYHHIDIDVIYAKNARDVPMLNERHPWVEGSDVFVVDREGAAFDVVCPVCQETVPTGRWWDHGAACGSFTITAHPPWRCESCDTDDESKRYDNGPACESCVTESFAEHG